MKKSIESLGEILGKQQLQSINGGFVDSCRTDNDCIGDFDPSCVIPTCIPTSSGFGVCFYITLC